MMLVAEAFSVTDVNWFVWGNAIEAGFWILLGLAMAIRAILSDASTRRSFWWAAVSLIAFGLSDIVEIQTGAWWRPWWLLAWKAVCVVALFVLSAAAIRRAKKNARRREPDNG